MKHFIFRAVIRKKLLMKLEYCRVACESFRLSHEFFISNLIVFPGTALFINFFLSENTTREFLAKREKFSILKSHELLIKPILSHESEEVV